MNDGSIIEAERAVARGGLAEPFSEGERVAKITDCFYGVEGVEAIIASLASLDTQTDLRFLYPVFHGGESSTSRQSA